MKTFKNLEELLIHLEPVSLKKILLEVSEFDFLKYFHVYYDGDNYPITQNFNINENIFPQSMRNVKNVTFHMTFSYCTYKVNHEPFDATRLQIFSAAIQRNYGIKFQKIQF